MTVVLVKTLEKKPRIIVNWSPNYCENQKFLTWQQCHCFQICSVSGINRLCGSMFWCVWVSSPHPQHVTLRETRACVCVVVIDEQCNTLWTTFCWYQLLQKKLWGFMRKMPPGFSAASLSCKLDTHQSNWQLKYQLKYSNQLNFDIFFLKLQPQSSSDEPTNRKKQMIVKWNENGA